MKIARKKFQTPKKSPWTDGSFWSVYLGEEERTLEQGRRSLLLSFQLFEVELEFTAFKNVSVNASRLTWARRDSGVEATRVELIGELRVNDAVLVESFDLALDGAGLFPSFTCFTRFFNLLLVQLNVVLLEVPLSEGGGINQDNGVLHEGLRANELVVGGIVGAVQNTGLGSHGLRTPGEVAVVASQSASLDVAAAATHVNAFLGAELGHGWDSSHFELSLFLVDWHAASRGPPLVPRVSRNTHTS